MRREGQEHRSLSGKAVVAALKQIYKTTDADAGKVAVEDFSDGPWGRIPGDRPVLAAELVGGHSVLRVP